VTDADSQVVASYQRGRSFNERDSPARPPDKPEIVHWRGVGEARPNDGAEVIYSIWGHAEYRTVAEHCREWKEAEFARSLLLGSRRQR
jgi:hypothetical protein